MQKLPVDKPSDLEKLGTSTIRSPTTTPSSNKETKKEETRPWCPRRNFNEPLVY